MKLSTLSFAAACSAFAVASILPHDAWAQSNNEVLFILDSSGSMKAAIKGESKIDSARRALRTALNELAPGTRVGLRLYAHRVPQAKKEESCLDTELKIPIEPLSTSRFEEALKEVNPLGYTPISYALQQSRSDFPIEAEAQRTIILLSDGEETCGGDPKAAAEALIKDGFKVKVHTIGFDVNNIAEAELKNIASITGGKYFKASNASELGSALKEAAAEAAIVQKAKTLYGEKVRGGDNFESAVPLQFEKELKLDHHQKSDDFDYFYFEGNVGDQIKLKVRTLEIGIAVDTAGKIKETDYPSVRMALHKADRTEMRAVWASGKFAGKEETVTLAEAGKYYILFGGGSPIHMDGATFQVERLSFGDLGSQKDAGGDLPDAAEITAGKYPGNYFSADEDLDVYSFNAAAGEQYFVAVVPQAGFSSTISVQVTDEYGEALQNESFRSGKTKPFSIPSDGKYFIQLKGCCWSDGPVKYMLELKKVSASPEPLPSSVANETAGATEG